MEGFATGFTPTQATKPGFAVENEKFRVTFDGVMCNDVKNIISHGFETCYDWRPVLELLLEAACEDYFMIQDIERKAEQRINNWLTSFQGWGLLSSMLPNLKHRHFILALAYTAANWNEDTGGERTDEKVFEAVKTVFEAVPGKRVSSLVPDLSCWFDEMVEGGMEEQRSKHFTLFFNAKWALEVRFIVEKRRQVESLLDRAAEVVVRRLETEEEVEKLTIPRTLLPAVKDKFRDALWVRSYWAFKALVQMARDEPYQVLSNGSTDSKEALGGIAEKRKEERGGGEKEEKDAPMSKQSKMRRLIGVSLWWAFYVLLVFFAYVCS